MFGPISQDQRTAARVVGSMYLLLGALAAFAQFYVRSGMLVDGNAAQTAHNILASEGLFRIGMASDVLGGAGNAVLAVAFYTLLRRVNPALALLAAFWRLGEAVILGHMTLNAMTVLHLLQDPAMSAVFSPGQLQALASLSIAVQGDEFRIGLLYYSLGSTLFCYLLLKSRYVPVVLAWWGLLASIAGAVCTVLILVLPRVDFLAPGCFAPVGIFELVTGAWLLIAGIRTPKV